MIPVFAKCISSPRYNACFFLITFGKSKRKGNILNLNPIFPMFIFLYGMHMITKGWLRRYSSPVTRLEGPRSFQEVKVPRFHDNGTGWW